jgi:uncharacterized oxidoreductase
MKVNGHTVLVTGGASGIGLALAVRFLAAGNDVIICGRRADKLREAGEKHRGIHTHASDLSDPSGREALARWVTAQFPKLDVVVNNAGIQHRVDLTGDVAWPFVHEEIATNLEAPIHLTTLLIPHLLRAAEPVVVNVTSGLAFVPRTAVPIYSATKAAMRSFTLSLRQQLEKTPIEVVEIIPPAVNTDLGGVGLHTFGVGLDEFADAAFAQLAAGEAEASYGFSAEARKASEDERAAMFRRINAG